MYALEYVIRVLYYYVKSYQRCSHQKFLDMIKAKRYPQQVLTHTVTVYSIRWCLTLAMVLSEFMYVYLRSPACNDVQRP